MVTFISVILLKSERAGLRRDSARCLTAVRPFVDLQCTGNLEREVRGHLLVKQVAEGRGTSGTVTSPCAA